MLQQTPNANRVHIGLFGKRNSGKSSLLNALCGQQVSVVSETAGTTTDPVYRPIELRGVGAAVVMDTAGVDDEGTLGHLRLDKTKQILQKTDIAIFVFSDADIEKLRPWILQCQEQHIPLLGVVNKTDILSGAKELAEQIKETYPMPVVLTSAKTGAGMDELKHALAHLVLKENIEEESITGHIIKPNDLVMLVMPQDSEAPKGRLILPQVQTMRELLDRNVMVMAVTPDTMEKALFQCKQPPQWIITDSQAFSFVYEHKPPESKLTSFSILFARYKGDLSAFLSGAKALSSLTETSHVLIAEACTHAPLGEDIGRVKLPALLRKKVGNGLKVTVVSGTDFPEDLSLYDLIIHCGGCMFNRRYVLSRIRAAEAANVPITNYGVAIAALKGILPVIDFR